MQLTLDWDIPKKKLAWRLVRLLNAFRGKHIRIKASDSKGYHIIIETACMTWKECLKLRKKWWDDKLRIEFDRGRYRLGIPTQVLFNYKKKVKKRKKKRE